MFEAESWRREPEWGRCPGGCYLRVWVSADDDGDRPRTAATQDRVDLVECHAVHGGVIDFHELVTAPVKAHTGSGRQATVPFPGAPLGAGPFDGT